MAWEEISKAIERFLRVDFPEAKRIVEETEISFDLDAVGFRPGSGLPPVYFTDGFLSDTVVDNVPLVLESLPRIIRSTDRYTAVIVQAEGRKEFRPLRDTKRGAR